MTAQSNSELTALAEEVEACRACALGGLRTRSVFGNGDPEADLMFVGEGPGFHEDQQGLPFVGAAGKLLDRLIEERLEMRRSGVWVCNVLKCRPPGNRDPLPAEVEACKPFLGRQLKLIEPKVVVALGNFASKLLTGSERGITKLRHDRFHLKNGTPLLCTFHPAAALRGGAAAEGIAIDFDEIKKVLDAQSRAAEVPEERVEEPAEQLGLF